MSMRYQKVISINTPDRLSVFTKPYKKPLSFLSHSFIKHSSSVPLPPVFPCLCLRSSSDADFSFKMLKGNAGVLFSVVFFDGENMVNVGEVMVDSSMNFKNFQSDLGQKIGVSPHQLSVYLGSPESNRKIPITRKVNFAAIAREKGGFFFVKRRPRRHKTRKESRHDENQSKKKTPPANVKLLRRNAGIDFFPTLPVFQTPILDGIEFGNRVRNLQMEKERYLMNMGLGGLCLGEESNANGNGNRNANGWELVCKVCSVGNASGRDVGFHWCVHDAVTEGFRSPAGPIARPVKKVG